MSQDNNNNYQFQPAGYTFWTDMQDSQTAETQTPGASEPAPKPTKENQVPTPVSAPQRQASQAQVPAPEVSAQQLPAPQVQVSAPEIRAQQLPAPQAQVPAPQDSAAQTPVQEQAAAPQVQTPSLEVSFYTTGIHQASPLGTTEVVKSRFWTYDTDGTVSSFTDQDGMRWTPAKRLETGVLYKSSDGGERIAKVSIQNNVCVIEDADGSITRIDSNGRCHIEHSAASKESEIRSLLNVFDKVDANGDQRLSLDELELALESDNHKESEKELIRSLKTQFARIKWTKQEMYGVSADGISLKDIVDVKGPKAQLGNEINETLVSYIEEVLDRVDQRIYGNIDPDTFSSVAARLKMPERLRFSIDVLLKRLRELNAYKRNGFDAIQWRPSRSAVRLMLCDIFKQFPELDNEEGSRWVAHEIQASECALYIDENDPIQCVVPEAIRNCIEANQTFMAVVTAIVKQNPSVIIGSIKRCGDAAYVVTFPGDKSLPVRVMAPTHKEICQYGLAQRFGIWALVIGKAFDEYAQLKNKTEIDDAIEIAQLLSAKQVETFSLADSSAEDLEAGIRQLWSEHRHMILGRYPNSSHGLDASDRILHHSFAIVGADPQTVTLHSPDTSRNDVKYRQFQVGWSELARQFDVLIYG